jgi:hypothetical protein
MSEFPDMMFPLVWGGKIVKNLLAEAAIAEAEGDDKLANDLFDRALKIDNSRH